jgi:general secretion pathway protein K
MTAAARPRAGRPPRRAGRDGFVIVPVLWILIVLSTLVAIYSIYVGNSAQALSVMGDGLQVDTLVSTGVELSVYRLTAPTTEPRPTHGVFRFRLGAANAVASYTPENARIDLNAATKDMLVAFFVGLGASAEEADWSAERIVGWRTVPKRGTQAAEDELYRTAGRTYLPRGAPFAHLSELWLVHGLPPALIERAMPFVTIYTGKPEINVFEAPPEVIAALPGMSPAKLNSFLDRRDTLPHDPDTLPLLLGPDQAGATAEASPTVRVRVQIAFDNGRKTASEVVVVLGADSEPYRVLSWQNDVDAGAERRQGATRLR